MQKKLFRKFLFKVTFWGINGSKEIRTVKVFTDVNDKNLAGTKAERLAEIKKYIRRKVELLPTYTDPWDYC